MMMKINQENIFYSAAQVLLALLKALLNVNV